MRPGTGRVDVLVEGIVPVAVVVVGLGKARHGLEADRAARILRVDEGGVVGRDGHAEALQDLGDVGLVLVGEGDDLGEGLDVLDVVLHLPVPVVPLLRRHVLVEGDVAVVSGLGHEVLLLLTERW